MKRHLLLAIGLSMAFCACKKETGLKPKPIETTNKAEKMYAVGFNLTGFSSETKGLTTMATTTAATKLSDQIKYFSYYVYKGSTDSLKFVKKIDQKSTDSSFGIIKDSLALGHYTIFFVGTKSPDYYVSNSFVDVTAGTYHPSLQFKNDNFDDTFASKLELDITGNNIANITLKRIVGLITFKLKDVLPANINKVVVVLGNAVPSYDLYFEGPAYNGTHSEGWSDREKTFTVKAVDKGKTNVEFSTYVWPHGSYLFPQINAYDAAGTLIGTRRIEDPDPNSILNVEANTQYIYSGYLFKPQSAGFTVTVDGKWNPPQTSPF
jgi:hypothetical protein